MTTRSSFCIATRTATISPATDNSSTAQERRRGEQGGAERRAGYRPGAEPIRAGGLVRRGSV
jgi:hypothetical protein